MSSNGKSYQLKRNSNREVPIIQHLHCLVRIYLIGNTVTANAYSFERERPSHCVDSSYPRKQTLEPYISALRNVE